jgi:ubiquinone/menaquinone biosynthesis C-methylase UbiE
VTPRHRDVEAFHERASSYEDGWRGRLHHDIVERTAALALTVDPVPRRVLDVGCGTGQLLGLLAGRLPGATDFAGIDAAAGMVTVAARQASDGRIRITQGVAERLPYEDRTFDMVVSSNSFDHWEDQARGLAECARVTAPGGHLVLVDLFSWWMMPTLLVGHRDRVRTVPAMTRLVTRAGYRSVTWHPLYASIVRAVTARMPPVSPG